MDDNQTIIEGEIEEASETNETLSSSTETTPTANVAVAEELNLEALIKRYISNIEITHQELKTQKEMFDSAFENDETYREHNRLAKEAAKVKSATRQQILKQPTVAALDEKIKDMKLQILEMENALSDYLQQYQKQTGATSIEGDDGEVREIVSVVKLVKRSAVLAGR